MAQNITATVKVVAPKAKAKKKNPVDAQKQRLAEATVAYGKAHGSCGHAVVQFVADALGVTNDEANALCGNQGQGAPTTVTVTYQYRVNAPVNVASATEHLNSRRDQVQAACELLTGSRYSWGASDHNNVIEPLSLDVVLDQN